MTPRLYLLGKSTFALSILLDMLTGSYAEVGLISNIADEDNDSLRYPYDTPGILVKTYQENAIQDWEDAQYVVASIGKSRKLIADYFIRKYPIPEDRFISLIHPSSVVPAVFHYGPGLHIGPMSVVAPYCTFGKFVVINRHASIGHHSILQDYVTINPGVTVAGICEIGEGTVIGAGATLLDKIKIGAGSIIGAGSVVTKDIPGGVVAYGSPAKVIRDI